MAPPSGVWLHFKKVFDEKEKKTKVNCNLCKQELSYCNSTTALSSHLLNKHKINVKVSEKLSNPARRQCTEEAKENDPDDPQEIPGPSQPKRANVDVVTDGPIKAWVYGVNAYARGGKKKQEVDDALLFMITHDNLPLNTPEKEGFKEFCKRLNQYYKLPCKKTTTTALSSKFHEIKLKVGPMLAKQENIVLTTDIWTETMTTRSFLGITAHFLQGIDMTSMAIGVRLMQERKTAENLKVLIKEILAEWKIDPSQVRAVITDRGANIKKACVELFGEEKHLACFAHLLNTAATNAIGFDKKSSHPEIDNPLPIDDNSDDESAKLKKKTS